MSKFILSFIYRFIPSLYMRLKTTGQTTNMAVCEHLNMYTNLWLYMTILPFFFFRRVKPANSSGPPWMALMSRAPHGKSNDIHSPVRLCVIGWWTKRALPKKDMYCGGLARGGLRRRVCETPLSPPAPNAFRLSYNAACFHHGLFGIPFTHSTSPTLKLIIWCIFLNRIYI